MNSILGPDYMCFISQLGFDMKRSIVTVIAIGLILSSNVSARCAAYKRTEFCDPLYSFVEKIMQIADNPDQQKRLLLYSLEQYKLLESAKNYFGDSWNPSQFIIDMQAFVHHQELYRQPPSGWSYNPGDDITMFNMIGKNGFAVYNQLTKWCWKAE